MTYSCSVEELTEMKRREFKRKRNMDSYKTRIR